MKRNITKLLSVVLAVVLVVGLLPATALAWAVYDVWVSGVQVTGLNAKDVLSDGGSVVFTSATGSEPAKLTLKNAKITGAPVPASAESSVGIFSTIDLILELTGSSSITAKDVSLTSAGIGLEGCKLTVSGSGTLDVTVGKGKFSYAVYAASLSMLGSTVRMTAGEASDRSDAVICADFVMEGGTLEATSGKGKNSRAFEAEEITMLGGTLEATAVNGENSSAIEAMDMTMQNGTVRATAGDATGDSCAVYAEELVMEGGTLEATAGKGEISCAVETDKMTIRGGAIRATAGEASEVSAAVLSSEFIMAGGTLEAKADKGEYSCAVEADEMTVQGGIIRAIAGEASEVSAAVRCDDFVMAGGTLEATAGKAENSYAIETEEMTMPGGTVRATAGEAMDESVAVLSDQFIVMEGGTLESTSGKCENSCAIATDEMTVRSGTIRATAGEASEESTAVYSDDLVVEGGVLIAAGGKADLSLGIQADTRIKGGTVTAIGQTRAYYNDPKLDGFKDPVFTINDQPTGTGAKVWNGTDDPGDGYILRYVRIAPYNPFTDVPEGQYYYEPVLWAIDREPQITTGTSADKFSPNATCTRAQVVTFLWRASGEPEPAKTENPFSDVKEGQYYYKAVLWAVEKGITTGTSADKFSPNAGCTRGQVVTFLHRAQGKPMPGSLNNPFTDVAEGQYYYAAILWAVHHSPQITNGTSADKFSPDATCTRGQIVTFLYRSMK